MSGASTINIPDTVGYNMPPSIWRIDIEDYRRECTKLKDAIFSVHCHNDLQFGSLNSLSSVLNGARQVGVR